MYVYHIVLASWAVGGLSTIVAAGPIFFFVEMDGFQVVDKGGNFGQGDADGFASGTITFDLELETVSWDFTYMNIDGVKGPDDLGNILGFHIHTGAFGEFGPALFELDHTQNEGFGTLVGEIFVPAQLMIPVLDDPSGFHLMFHTTAFPLPGAAVRGQIPEPATLSLVALGGLLATRRRRR